MTAEQERVEALGPAERIINSLTQYSDHMVHNRPGLVTLDQRQRVGVRWQQATWIKQEDGQKFVYTTEKVGKKTRRTQVGVGVPGTDEVRNNGRVIGRWQPPGLFPEVVAYLYEQIAEVWRIDNEFAAKWASWAFNNEDSRDLKVLLAAFMLVQSRFGEPIKEGDETFQDEDYRAVGEAMCLLRTKKGQFNPKLLLRIGQVLELPQVADINRKMGFGQSGRRAVVGRYHRVLEKWLHNIETNVKVLEKLIKEGFRSSIMQVCRKVGYKPESEKFFELLRWKQVQASDGRREIAVGKEVKAADTWDGLDEEQVCERIIQEKPNYKTLVGKLPQGLTPAIMAAAVEAGSLSDTDLIILTPTLEELGLLEDADIKKRWEEATQKAENQRASNIKRNVRSKEVQDTLEAASDKAAAKAVEEVTKDMQIYVVVDKSGSMQGAIDQAKQYLKRFVGAFPLDKLHVCVFNTVGREVEIKAPTAAAVEQAFRGHTAGGGTSYANGVGCLVNKYKPGPDEDCIIIFVGDEEDSGLDALVRVIQQSGVQPMALGLLHVDSGYSFYGGHYRSARGPLIEQAAVRLGVPCFKIEEAIFADPYAVPRTIRNIIASTPVRASATPAPRRRVSIIDTILKTPLLRKPAWA